MDITNEVDIVDIVHGTIKYSPIHLEGSPLYLVISRFCVVCSKKLSGYNLSDKCFHHTEQEIGEQLSIFHAQLATTAVEKIAKETYVKPKQFDVIPDVNGSDIFDEILFSIVEETCVISRKGILSPNRKKEFVLARQILTYLLRIESERSFLSIGKLMGQDHTTVIHSCRKIEQMMKTDSHLTKTIDSIRDKLCLAVEAN